MQQNCTVWLYIPNHSGPYLMSNGEIMKLMLTISVNPAPRCQHFITQENTRIYRKLLSSKNLFYVLSFQTNGKKKKTLSQDCYIDFKAKGNHLKYVLFNYMIEYLNKLCVLHCKAALNWLHLHCMENIQSIKR